MLKAILGRIRNGQYGFTLIELMAVMGIVAVLATIVSTSVVGTGDTAREATAQQDAGTTQTTAATYFLDQGAPPVLTTTPTTLTITSVSSIPVNVSGEDNVTSDAWPEQAIPVAYSEEFQSSFERTVLDVELKLDDTTLVNEATLMADYTAIDFDLLTGSTAGYADAAPASATDTRVINTNTNVTVNQYLWLFVKTTGSTGNPDDSRSVVVFVLKSATIASGNDKVSLKYEQIF